MDEYTENGKLFLILRHDKHSAAHRPTHIFWLLIATFPAEPKAPDYEASFTVANAERN